jgi:putative phosphoesterase
LKIAVISDTHDRLPYITKTVEILNQMEIDLVIHCGDYSAPFAVKPYAHLKHPLLGIYGNNDAEKSLIASGLKQGGKDIKGEFANLKLGEANVAVVHGHNRELFEALIESKGFHIVLYGHTHHPKIEWKDTTLTLNPGEICGYLTGESTYAVLETVTMKADIIPIST